MMQFWDKNLKASLNDPNSLVKNSAQLAIENIPKTNSKFFQK